MDQGQPGDPELLLELARQSYAEVLDATKHQDDKIGRLFSGIAFLIGGATASLGLAEGVLRIRYQVGTFLIPLPIPLIVAFYVSIVLAVLLLIINLGSPLKLPRARSGDREHSLLFFLSIAADDLEAWTDRWRKGPRDLRGEAADDYVDEAHNLALRTAYKYERTNEAIQFLTLAILCFALTTVVSLVAAGGRDLAAGVVLEWSTLPRLTVAATIATFAYAIAYSAVRHDLSFASRRTGPPPESGQLAAGLQRSTLPIPGACALYVVSVVAPGALGTRLVGVVGALAAVAVLAVALGPRMAAVGLSGLVSVLWGFGAAAAVVLLVDRPELQLALGMLVGVLLALSRMVVRLCAAGVRLVQSLNRAAGGGRRP